jgi:hypothetical protein
LVKASQLVVVLLVVKVSVVVPSVLVLLVVKVSVVVPSVLVLVVVNVFVGSGQYSTVGSHVVATGVYDVTDLHFSSSHVLVVVAAYSK